MRNANERLTGRWRDICLLALVVTSVAALQAQNTPASPQAVQFQVLADFDGTDGSGPGADLQAVMQGPDGNLYGAAEGGGAYNNGVIFKLTPEGTLTTLYSFCPQPDCADGQYPGTPVLGPDGAFYGTTGYYGAFNAGTFFRLTLEGELTTLYNFPNGSYNRGITLGIDGNFYGTTASGGANGQGTVFKVTPDGHLTTLYSFCSQPNCNDGSSPGAPVIQGADGNLYGTCQFGGPTNAGTVFSVRPTGQLRWVYRLCLQESCLDGFYPTGELVQAPDGNIYGTTGAGGTYDGRRPGGNLGGVVFKITTAGDLTPIYSFCAQQTTNCPDGYYPNGVVEGTDGSLYGTTNGGGVNSCYMLTLEAGCGTIFKVTAGGTLTTLHTFDGTDGEDSLAGLTQNTNGTFYGAASEGGTNMCFVSCGTAYVLSTGLGPFIETVPAGGTVGETIQILGNNLTGATNVSFNGRAAWFTVESETLIQAIVPAGAITGFVMVAGPSGTLTSNTRFVVRKVRE